MSNNELHVIFGTGPVGLAVMDELLAKGKQVRVINRSGRKADIPQNVEVVTGDAMNAEFVKTASDGATHIYQALNPPYSKWLEMFATLQTNVVEVAAHHNAKVIVMDNLYSYGDTHGKPMTETTPVNPNTRKGKLRAQMTADLMAAHKSGRVQAVAIKASDFVGPRVLLSAMGERVVPEVLAGKNVMILGDPDKLHSYSYMPDVAKTVVAAALDDSAYGQIWHVPVSETLTTRRFIERLYEAAGTSGKVGSAPMPIVHIMGLFNADLREVIEMVYEFKEDFVIDGSKAVAKFGIEATPIDEVISETIAWYRQHLSEKHAA